MSVHEGFLEELTAVGWGGTPLTVAVFTGLPENLDQIRFLHDSEDAELAGSRFQKMWTGETSEETVDFRLVPVNADPYTLSLTRSESTDPARVDAAYFDQGPFYDLTGALLTHADRPCLGYSITPAFPGYPSDFPRLMIASLPSYTGTNKQLSVGPWNHAGDLRIRWRADLFSALNTLSVTYNTSTSQATMAAGMASAINSEPVLSDLCSASSAGSVITLAQVTDGLGVHIAGVQSPFSQLCAITTVTGIPTIASAGPALPGWTNGETAN